MNNKNEYKVKFIKFSDGERYPLLINSTGIPEVVGKIQTILRRN